MLHHVVEGRGPRVVLLHGFTQTLRSWDDLAARLVDDGFEVVRVDAPGHGGSSRLRLEVPATAAALGDLGGEAAYVGYSMGGRVCLRLALDRPSAVRALVLIGASPGLPDAGERTARRAADEAWAREIERDGVGSFLERWLDQPLFAGLPRERAGVAQRLANPADGLAASLRLLGTGAQEPLWDRLGDLQSPTLIIAGEKDAKFAAVAADMKAMVGPHAEMLLIPGAGHAAHLERPGAVGEAVLRFLRAHAC